MEGDAGYGLKVLYGEKLKPSDLLTKDGILEIIAVHGLGGDREKTWSLVQKEEGPAKKTHKREDIADMKKLGNDQCEPEIESGRRKSNKSSSHSKKEISWLRDFLPTYLPHARVSTYGYNLQEEGISNVKIDEKARELLHELHNNTLSDHTIVDEGTPEGSDPSVDSAEHRRTFVFIGHNLGGCIIKQALILANTEPLYSEVARNTSLTFFGTPHRAKDQVEWEMLAYNLLHATGQRDHGCLSDLLRKSSFALRDVNERYATIATTYRAISIVETVKLFSFGDIVFDKERAYMGIQNETVMDQHSDHMEMCRNIDDNDTLFQRLYEGIMSAPAPDPNYIDCLSTLSLQHNQAAQISNSSLLTSVKFDSILSHENFRKFLETKNTCVLHLHGQPGSGLSVLSRYLSVYLKQHVWQGRPDETVGDGIILAFSFEACDFRTCCTSAMFASLTQQLLIAEPANFRKIRYLYDRATRQTVYRSPEIFWALLRSVILNPPTNPICCLIDAVDKYYIHNDGKPEMWPSSFDINVNGISSKDKELEEYVDKEISKLVNTRPAFGDWAETIRTKALTMKPGFLGIYLVFKWLDSSEARSTPYEIQSIVNSMPLSLTEIYQQGLVGSRIYSSDWNLKALFWISKARRPLKLEELATALAVELEDEGLRVIQGNRPKDLAQDLKRAFGSFLEFHDGEVFFIHESAKDFLPDSVKSWHPKGKPNLLGDRYMANVCLECLLQQSREFSPSANTNAAGVPDREDTSSLLPYAARYWHVHYRVAPSHDFLAEKVQDFIMRQNQRDVGWQIKWERADKFKSTRDACNPLLIAAELGLSDTLLQIVDEQSCDNTLLPRLLEIAASRGDDTLLMQLMKRGLQLTECFALHRAAQNDHLDTVAYLLEKGAEMNTAKEGFETALNSASRNGYLAIVEKLLDKGANADAKVNQTGPLHLAAEFGHWHICQRLISEKVDINASNEDGSTPLHLATTSGQFEVMQLLIDSKADVNSLDNRLYNPLHLAAASGHSDAVKHLLLNNSNIEATTEEGATPLFLGVTGGHVDVVRELISKCGGLDIPTGGLGPSLSAAVKQGSSELVNLLLDAGADLNTFDGQLQTPLHLAARYGAMSLVENLLGRKEVEINKVDNENRTALHLAAYNGNFGAVRALVEAEAFPNVVDKLGFTPISKASERGDLKTVRKLIDAEADVQPLDRLPSALHHAVDGGHVEVMSALLEAGAYPEAEDDWGNTPLHSAAGSGELGAVQLLLDSKVYTDPTEAVHGRTPLLQAATQGYLDIMKELLDAGASVEIQDNTGSDFLHIAVAQTSLETLNLAIDRKCDVLSKDNDDNIPLHIAAKTGFTRGATRLLEVGDKTLQVEATNTDKRTALHMAAISGDKQTVELLYSFGSDIEASDSNEQSPLHLATEEQHYDVASLLVSKGADANKRDSKGRTPIFMAFEASNEGLVRLLLPETKDLTAMDNSKQTLLHMAADCGMFQVVKDLIQLGLDICACNDEDDTPLSLAAINGHLEIVNTLLEAGASTVLDYVNQRGQTAISSAIELDKRDVFEALVKAGAKLDVDENTSPAVYTAAYYGRLDILRDLISLQLDIERTGPNSWTPLHAAFDNPEATSILLQAGAKSDALNSSGETSLHLAAKYGYLETTQVLLKNDLNPLKRDNDGVTPLHYAIRRGDLELVKMLLEFSHGNIDIEDNEGYTPLRQALKSRQIEIAKLLLTSDRYNINQKNAQDVNLLQEVMEDTNETLEDKKAMLEVLIKGRAQSDHFFGTSLMKMAATVGSFSFVQMLLGQGIDANSPDENGWTPEVFARAMHNHAALEVLRAARGDNAPTPKRPSCWSESVKSPLLDLNESRMIVEYIEKEEEDYNYEYGGSIHADHPIPILEDATHFYYEIEVLKTLDSQIGIGVARGGTPLTGVPGWERTSWGYHGDSGEIYHEGIGSEYDNSGFGEGDIVGCWYDVPKQELRFTKNGELLGVAYTGVLGQLFPVVGFSAGTKVTVNFGRELFKYQKE